VLNCILVIEVVTGTLNGCNATTGIRVTLQLLVLGEVKL